MFEGRRCVVVVPAYNEEKLIRRVLDEIPEFVDRIFVVDDGSIDRTAALVEEAPEPGGRTRLIRHDKNHGVGAAIVSGYRAAIADAQGNDLVVVMAGDAQMDPAELPRLLRPLVRDQADYTKG